MQMRKKDFSGLQINKSLIPTENEPQDGGSYESMPVKEVDDEWVKQHAPTGIDDSLLSIYDGPRYGKKTLKELKKMCKDRDIPISGTKKVLIDRLVEHLKIVKKEKSIEEKKEREVKRKEDELINNSIKQKVKVLENRLRIKQRQRKEKLELVAKSQSEFDEIELECNEIKATINSFKNFF